MLGAQASRARLILVKSSHSNRCMMGVSGAFVLEVLGPYACPASNFDRQLGC